MKYIIETKENELNEEEGKTRRYTTCSGDQWGSSRVLLRYSPKFLKNSTGWPTLGPKPGQGSSNTYCRNKSGASVMKTVYSDSRKECLSVFVCANAPYRSDPTQPKYVGRAKPYNRRRLFRSVCTILIDLRSSEIHFYVVVAGCGWLGGKVAALLYEYSVSTEPESALK